MGDNFEVPRGSENRWVALVSQMPVVQAIEADAVSHGKMGNDSSRGGGGEQGIHVEMDIT